MSISIPPDAKHMYAPPWRVDPPTLPFATWTVTTDRGDPSDEYDVLEDPPEWLCRLLVVAPKLLAFAEAYIDLFRDADMSPEDGCHEL